jgi:hypothetical protein
MRYVFFDDNELGVLQDGRVYSIAPLLAEAGAHDAQEALEYLIANESLLRPSIREALATQGGARGGRRAAASAGAAPLEVALRVRELL